MLRTIKRWIKGDPTKSLAPKGTVGLLAIMKNETDVLREWIEHYRWQGVDKIFLIDNGSTDNPEALLKDELQSGFVQLFHRCAPYRQAQHYQAVFKQAKIRTQVEWLVMADLDEFWYSPLGDLKKAIATIDTNFDLLYANWIMFGSSGLVEQPQSIREGFVHRWEDLGGHPSTKWICRTFKLTQLWKMNQHKVGGIDSRRVVFDNVNFRLNHYPIMSREYFQRVKMTRGDVNEKSSNSLRTMEYFETYDRPAIVVDTTLAEMVKGSRAGNS